MIIPRAVPVLLPAHHRRVASYQAITNMTLPTPWAPPPSPGSPVRPRACLDVLAWARESPTVRTYFAEITSVWLVLTR
jgi:hypothetical protein